MAIVIPSKNIYGDIDNPKVAENAIGKIEISDTKAQIVTTNQNTNNLSDKITFDSWGSETTNQHYKIIERPNSAENIVSGTWVFNSTITLPSSNIEQSVKFRSNNTDYTKIAIYSGTLVFENTEAGTRVYMDGWVNSNYRTISFEDVSNVEPAFWSWLTANATWQLMLLGGCKTVSKHFNSQISLNRHKDNYYIQDVAPQIDVDYDVKIYKLRATSTWGQTPTFEYYDAEIWQETFCNNLNFTHEFQTFNFSQNFKLSSSVSILNDKISCYFNLNSGQEQISYFNVDRYASVINTNYPYKITATTQQDNISFDIKAIGELKVWVSSNYTETATRGNFGNIAEAYLIEFVAKEARIVYNETIRYLAEEEKTEILSQSGSSGEEVLSVAKNSLIKNGSARAMYDMTLEKYSLGKEIATLRCSVGEYYDENGNLVISTKTPNKMLFEHYDKVVPMVRSASGVDVPMSVNSEGKAKVFEVVGVKEVYDGAILQELTLCEYIEVAPLYVPTEQLTYALYDGTYACTGLSDTTIKNIKVAKSIDGIPVTAIDFGAFQTLLIQSVVIPDSVNIIDENAFSGCTKLSEVRIGNGIKEIRSSAFYNTGYSKKVYITNVEKWCGITFKSVAANPFYGGAELYLKDKIVENLVIPNGVVKIGEYTFSACKSINQLTIPDSVTRIETTAFSGCSSLKNITIGKNVSYIGSYAFSGCVALTSVEIPDSVTSIDLSAFNNCANLASVVIGNGITNLNSSAFSNCRNLTDIYVPWSEGKIANAPWGATNATIHYNSEV